MVAAALQSSLPFHRNGDRIYLVVSLRKRYALAKESRVMLFPELLWLK
jgi:hypothetical protein